MIHPDNIFGRLGNRMFQGAYMIAQAKRGWIDDIYAQNYEYFEDCADSIKALYGQGIPQETDMIAVHVRRGDYVGHSFYVDLIQTDYYDKAMDLFPNEKFLIFSDDIDFCKKWFHGKQYEFYHGTELEDMNLMASCKGIIMANSSFSWWASFISPYAQKIVAPSVENWYSDSIERTTCPSDWIRI